MSKLIITAALTGAVTSRSHTPYVPITQQEIADEAARCADAGAAVVHLHLRDTNGKPSNDVTAFRELVAAVRAKTNALICLSTSSWGTESSVAERIASTSIQPELVSFHVSSMNRGDQVFLNPPEYQRALGEAALKFSIKPEFELFDLAQLYQALEIHQTYVFSNPIYVQFVLGARGGCPAEPRHLLHMVQSLPPGALWSVAAVGKGQLPMNLLAMILGGHVRTGLEDNVYLRKGELAAGNAVLVERIVTFAKELGREIASVADAKELLGINS